MHRDLYTYHCESDHCRVSAVIAPSAQKIATIALALLILSLSIIDWHVPRCFRSHQLLCRILTAMSMQALRVELACTVIAFLLPTFGKRSQDQGSTSRKRSTPTRPATEQTPEIPSDAEATMHDPKSTPVLRRCDFAVEPDAAIEHIGMAWLSTIDDVTLISTLEHFTSLSLRRFGQAVQHSCWCAFASSHNERLKLVADHQIVQCACCVECQTIAPCCECY